jgi:Peptidase inhibitor I78 family
MKPKSSPASLAIVFGLASFSACATEAPVAPSAALTDEVHPCQTDAVGSYVGRVADQATVAGAIRLSGSSFARIVKPGQPISMEYTTDRLTIEVDEKNRILRLYCS